MGVCGLALPCLPIFLVVASCGVIPGYQERFEAARAAQQQAISDADDAHCRSLGTTPGSAAYVYCREAAAGNRQAGDEAQRRAWLGVAQVGSQMMATPPPPPQPPSLDPANHVCVAPNNTLYRC